MKNNNISTLIDKYYTTNKSQLFIDTFISIKINNFYHG